jgi:hypothetical protein
VMRPWTVLRHTECRNDLSLRSEAVSRFELTRITPVP